MSEDFPPTLTPSEAVADELAQCKARLETLSEYASKTAGELEAERAERLRFQAKYAKCLTIARDALNQEWTGNVDGDRIYCNGWRHCAESIIEKIGPA